MRQQGERQGEAKRDKMVRDRERNIGRETEGERVEEKEGVK
jgi:hypothetical protein